MPAISAISWRRRPATRRRFPAEIPACSGRSFARLEARNSPSSRCWLTASVWVIRLAGGLAGTRLARPRFGRMLDDLCQGVGLRAGHEGVHDHCVTNDIDTLATALFVRTDDLLKQYPDLAPWRPKIGLQPRLTDAELVTLAVMQALLGYTSESRWIRHARARLGHLFPYLPGQPGYNRRLRAAAGLITTLIRLLAADTS